MNAVEGSYDPSLDPYNGKTTGRMGIEEEVIAPSSYLQTEYCITLNTPPDYPVLLSREYIDEPYGVPERVVALAADAFDSAPTNAYRQAFEVAYAWYFGASNEERIQIATHIARYVSSPVVLHKYTYSCELLSTNSSRLRQYGHQGSAQTLLPAISKVIQHVANTRGLDAYRTVHIDDVVDGAYAANSHIRHVLLRLGTGEQRWMNGHTYQFTWVNNQFDAVICRNGLPGRQVIESNLLHVPLQQGVTTPLYRVDLMACGDIEGLYEHRPGMSYAMGDKLERYYWKGVLNNDLERSENWQ